MMQSKWINKNKWIWHIIFWIIYILIWGVRNLAFHSNYLDLLRTNSLIVLPYIPLIYLNLYYLVPRFLLKGQYANYFLLLLPCFVVVFFISKYQYYWLFHHIYDAQSEASFFISVEGLAAISTEMMILLALSMTIYLLKEWYQKERYAKELEQQQLTAELTLLKQQINPHFVFNTLNTIYHLMEKRTDQAKEVLLQFSDTLSHQLYDTSKEQIPLNKEVDYLKNYIAIEQLRHGDHLQLDCQWPEQDDLSYPIAPMLLIPFVENAFKHGRSADGYWIKLDMKITDEDALSFVVQNKAKVPKINSRPKQNGGIGLANVRRRLNLIYPGKHQLDITDQQESFTAHLKIKLHEH